VHDLYWQKNFVNDNFVSSAELHRFHASLHSICFYASGVSFLMKSDACVEL